MIYINAGSVKSTGSTLTTTRTTSTLRSIQSARISSRSWGNRATKDVWDGLNTKAARSIPRTAWPAVAMKLELVDAAAVIGDLAAPPGNRLEALKGDPQGDYSIRVNRQFRITFRFRDGDAYGVRCEDYH